ncbi:MAG: radical SAM protein [Verrucomicrobiota bacterium]|jgi:anaerobic magnesium-protoporphyrin IX monomethyl ester cyclase
MSDLFLFVRPPRPLWPFNSPASAFWPPLAFASLAAMLREQVRDLRVEILDAPALAMGWRTLEAEIHRRRPAFVGIGEEAVSCVEGLRLARLARAGGARVIAGGCFFGQLAPQALATGLIDVVVHGEGELTLVELVQALRGGPGEALAKVDGISFRAGGSEGAVVTTPPRQLLPDLDALPLPAYDLLPVERYGARSLNHPRLAAVELGRGCFGCCDFCVLWRQMGRFTGGRLVPHLRVKSPARMLEEVRLLVRRYGRRYLGWVDPCFNADARAPGQVAELMLREGLRVGQSAWVRTDALVRDARSGALASCVRAGLNEVYLGIERADAASLAALHKTSGVAEARAALEILREQFPAVLAIGSFIYGLPGDSPRAVRAIHRLAIELGLDQFFFIPLTPLPGTQGWRAELWDPTGERFREFNFLPTGRPHGRYAALERALLFSLLCNWPPARLRSWRQRLFCGDARKRRVHRRLQTRAARFHLGRLLNRALGGGDDLGLVFPRWYEG